jgi:hypothetical protein
VALRSRIQSNKLTRNDLTLLSIQNKEELDLTIENIPAAVQAEMFELLRRPNERKEDPKRDRATSDSSSFSSFGSDYGNSSDGSEKGI